MPLYEYECESCAQRFERIQRYSDPPIDTCPTCGGSVRKLFSSPAIQFKGSGWYITDYAKKGSEKSRTDSGTDAKETTDKTGDKSSDTSSEKTAEKSSDKGSASKDSPKSA